eukprot:Platyproteum_vivax@DN15242_c0_g1_i1.p1
MNTFITVSLILALVALGANAQAKNGKLSYRLAWKVSVQPVRPAVFETVVNDAAKFLSDNTYASEFGQATSRGAVSRNVPYNVPLEMKAGNKAKLNVTLYSDDHIHIALIPDGTTKLASGTELVYDKKKWGITKSGGKDSLTYMDSGNFALQFQAGDDIKFSSAVRTTAILGVLAGMNLAFL